MVIVGRTFNESILVLTYFTGVEKLNQGFQAGPVKVGERNGHSHEGLRSMSLADASQNGADR